MGEEMGERERRKEKKKGGVRVRVRIHLVKANSYTRMETH